MEIATIFAKGYLKLFFYLFLLLSIKYGQRKSIIFRSFVAELILLSFEDL